MGRWRLVLERIISSAAEYLTDKLPAEPKCWGSDADDAGHGEDDRGLSGRELNELLEMSDADGVVGSPGGFHFDVSSLFAEKIGCALPFGAVVVVEGDAAEEEGLGCRRRFVRLARL